jgi:hypothetical protein
MSLVQNEKAKLRATFLNNVGVGCITAGVIAPTFALLLTQAVLSRTVIIVLISVIWFLIGLLLHFIGQATLERIKE